MKTDREKLSELAQEANEEISKRIELDELTDAKTAWLAFADYLIEHGVTIPVRCKDCKMFVENKEAVVTYCRRGLNNFDVKPDDYCNYGERKET